MSDSLHILGTGDSMGVPRVYCDCIVCEEARTTGVNRRLRSSAMLRTGQGDVLIDCGPDFTLQMETARWRMVTDMLITHAHFDHIGGLPAWADACRWTQTKGRLYAPAEVLATLRVQFPWLERQITFFPNDHGVQLAGWTVRPWKVNHGKNGFAYAYRFEKPGFTWVYASDCINLSDEQRAPMYGLDLLIIGTSFVKEPFPMETRSLYDMTEALELVQVLQPKQTVLTHMSHGVDLNHLGLELPEHVKPASAGDILGLE
ncbi:MBL fold metallo-hydrolase [Paenibacillus turpanensis]|uniref:MBL fold metallo-hydrolase n=1 Tax=Paenibacillus turpanensis TaxID=2689078 RepID=UPI001408E293|nr:MBL fold metallo-hydrolase [Paenibacillus turpanensis]